MKIFMLSLIIMTLSQRAWAATCKLKPTVGNHHQCEIQFTPKYENYFLVFPKNSKIRNLKINHNSVVHDGEAYFENLGGYILVAKSAYPIPRGFFQSGVQNILIEWTKAPKAEFEISIQENVRSPATEFINYIPSAFVLTFILILLFIRNEFIDEQNFFQISLMTGLVLALHLYLNSLEPYLFFHNWVNHVSKMHVLTTSLSTVLLIQLTDNFLHFFKRKWYWSATIITLILLLLAPWESGDAYTNLIIQCLVPSMIITTLIVILITIKIIRYKLYLKDNSYYPIIISGVLVALICVIDTLIAIYDKFGEPPISGFGLLLYYIIVNLTFIIRSKKMKINQLAIHEEVASISRQVAHDIKSPLAALKIAIESFTEIPSDKKHFIKRSVERIDDIINDLQQKSQREENKESILLISSVINAVISEKRLTLNNKDLTISNTTDDQLHHVFIRANRSVLKRVLSNLLNNAIEALNKGRGNIEINATVLDQQWCKIIVQDNGKGIPIEIIEHIKQKDFSYDKAGGQGLGLSYVNQQINLWHGKLNIVSKLESGTKVEFTTPRSHPPNWFCQSLNLASVDTLYVIDDDSSIFEMWKDKLQTFPIRMLHIQTPDDFRQHLSKIDTPNNFVIIDLDYMGSSVSGFSLIHQLKHAQCILSTSRFEEGEVQNRCELEQIQLLSKDYIQFVTVSQTKTIVLIDNDELICQGWKIIGDIKKINVHCYKSYNELPQLVKTTTIYIDYELEDEMNGIDVAKKLFDQGFTQLYLSTGHTDINLADYPFLKGIVGKDFPQII